MIVRGQLKLKGLKAGGMDQPLQMTIPCSLPLAEVLQISFHGLCLRGSFRSTEGVLHWSLLAFRGGFS